MCHQTVSLVARYLEAHGIPTVIMGCAKDIVEYVGVPRFLFSDFPLGNAAGKPNDPHSQAATLEELEKRRRAFDENKEIARKKREAEGIKTHAAE